MKCWIEDRECVIHAGGKQSGLLSVASNFCQKCSVLSLNWDEMEEVFDKVGIDLCTHRIGEEEESSLIKYNRILLEALELLEEKRKKEIAEIDEEAFEKAIETDDRILKIKDFITEQKKLMEDLAEIEDLTSLQSNLEKIIQEAEVVIENVKQQIRKEVFITEEKDEKLDSIRWLVEVMEKLEKLKEGI